MEDDLGQSCCQNPRCLAFGTRGAGNVYVCGRIGKHKHIRQLRCRTCGKRFSERKGTVFYRGADAGFATQRDVSRTKRDINTFEVRLRLDNADRRLASGMTAYVALPVSQ